MVEKENARIVRADLGIEDHGIFTCSLTLEGDGWGQGFGGYRLDTYDKEKKKCVGSKEGMDFIMSLLDTFGVSMWSELTGLHCRIEREGGFITRIGHITKNKWFDPKKIFEKEEET